VAKLLFALVFCDMRLKCLQVLVVYASLSAVAAAAELAAFWVGDQVHVLQGLKQLLLLMPTKVAAVTRRSPKHYQTLTCRTRSTCVVRLCAVRSVEPQFLPCLETVRLTDLAVCIASCASPEHIVRHLFSHSLEISVGILLSIIVFYGLSHRDKSRAT
jgi:hypothetical protein